MVKKPFSIDLLVDLVKHVPEGYLEWQQIHENFDVKKMNGSWKSISKEVSQRGVGCKGLTFFDASRVSWKDVCQKQTWSYPQIPPIASDGRVVGPTIQELVQIRKRSILARDVPLVDVSFPFTIAIGSVRIATWISVMTNVYSKLKRMILVSRMTSEGT
jgi:hypothetical protein